MFLFLRNIPIHAMKIPAPHFLLFSESHPKSDRGDWRFVLQSVDGLDKIEAADVEPRMQGERLELLTVVRGLEALEQPSRVTIVTPSKYVSRGILNSLEEWRANDWHWESFGQMVPVKNQDLWRRIDRAMAFHHVECRAWRFEGVTDDFQSPEPQPIVRAVTQPAEPQPAASQPIVPVELQRRKRAKQAADEKAPVLPTQPQWKSSPQDVARKPQRRLTISRVRRKCLRLSLMVQRRSGQAMENFYHSLAEFGTGLLPKPWLE